MRWVKSLLTVANSSLIILVIFFTKIDPIGWFEKYLPQDLITKLKTPTVRIAINNAIILLLVQIILALFSKPILLYVNLNNMDGTPFTNIPMGSSNQRPKKLNLDVNINYKNKFLKWLISTLGGLYIFVDNTTWTSIQAEKNSQLFREAVDDSTTNEYICIKLDKLLGKSETKKSFRINLNVLSNSPDPMPGTLHVGYSSENRNIIIKFILGLLISFGGCTHEIQSSREAI